MFILLTVVAILVVVCVCVLENGNVMIFGSSEGQTEKKAFEQMRQQNEQTKHRPLSFSWSLKSKTKTK